MIDELKRFILAAEEGNLTKASKKLFITQSALTQSIQRLEKNLDTKLFIQKGKYLHLTNDGNAIVNIGKKISQLWENANDKEKRKAYKQAYSIGMFDNAALKLGNFIKEQIGENNFVIEFTIDSSSKLFTQLKLGTLEAAICVISEKNVIPKDIILIQSFTEILLPVTSKQFSGSIQQIPFILYNKDSYSREQLDRVFKNANITPNIFAESTSTTFMKELAILGSGVALLPENAVKVELRQGLLIKQKLPRKLTWKRHYGLFISRQSELQKNHQLIKGLVRVLKSSK